jgi:uncharacterized membrane protein/Tfp pilus assembly protein PilF
LTNPPPIGANYGDTLHYLDRERGDENIVSKSKKKPLRRSDGTAPAQGPAVESYGVDGDVSSRVEIANSISLGSILASLPSKLPWIFLALAIPSVLFLSVCTPPFQSPDELAHFERSYQISRGGIYGGAGGYVDRGIDQAQSLYSHLPFAPRDRITAADQFAAAGMTWTGQTIYRDFPNTAHYSPIGYLPQALGVVLGRIADLSVVHTLILSRLLNGALAIFISALALSWCGRGKLVMFALLLMPMTMSLYGSCSQDASIISITCLAFAIVSRQIAGNIPLSLRMTIVLASSLLVIVLERPPYIPLLLVLLVPGLLPRWWQKPAWMPGLSLAGLLAILTVIWWLAASSPGNMGGDSHVNAKLQLLNLFHHPGVIPQVIEGTSKYYPVLLKEVIGVLGWLDTHMPDPYYLVMVLMLLVAMVAELAYRGRFKSSATTILLLAASSAFPLVFLSQYLVWTPVGELAVEGVQGRYLIPLMIAGCVGLPRLIPSDRVYRLATAAVVLSQPLTLIYLPKVIIDRYYLMAAQPNFITERLFYADALLKQGYLDDAAQENRQVISIDPNNIEAHNDLAGVLSKQGFHAEAVKELRLSLAIKPDQAEAHFKIGLIFAETHQLSDAVQEFDQALRFDPSDAITHNDLGVALVQLGEFAKAAEQFRDALRIDPSYADARTYLGIAEAQLKNKKVQVGRK